MVTNRLHEIYHVFEELVAKVFGENARYRLIYFLRTGKYLNLDIITSSNVNIFEICLHYSIKSFLTRFYSKKVNICPKSLLK